jgi:hypothetical protein
VQKEQESGGLAIYGTRTSRVITWVAVSREEPPSWAERREPSSSSAFPSFVHPSRLGCKEEKDLRADLEEWASSSHAPERVQ